MEFCVSGFASRQKKENPNVLIGNPSGYRGQTDCLLFSPSTPPAPPRPAPPPQNLINFQPLRTTHSITIVSQINFCITTVHIPHGASLCLEHNNLTQNLCSLMQLVAIWRRMCGHCYRVCNQQSGKFECQWPMKS